MADEKKDRPINAVMVVIAVIVTAGAIANAISALRTDAVWTLAAKGFSLHEIERMADPFSFYVILGANAALAAYMDFDLWRRYRRNQHN